MPGSDPLLEPAQQALAAGNAAGALALLHRLGPRRDGAYLHLMGIVLRRLGRMHEAKAAFEAARAASPDEPYLLNNFANLLKQMTEYGGALALYEEALRLLPSYRDAAFNRALTLRALGRLDSARAALDALAAAHPADAAIWSALGGVELAMMDVDAAAAAFDTALRLDPTRATALGGRAEVALNRGEAAASTLFSRARQIAPASRALLLGHAEALEAEGDNAGIALLQQAVRQEPDWLRGYERLAAMRAEAGDPQWDDHYAAGLAKQGVDENALRRSWAASRRHADDPGGALEVLAPLDPEPDVQAMRAFLLSELGQPLKALRLIEGLDAAGPELPRLRGQLSLQAGDYARGAASLEEAVARDPEDIASWALTEVAWRLMDDPRASWLSGQPGLFGSRDVGLSETEWQAAAELCRSLHRTRAHPVGQSLRGGTQTRGRLFLRQEPELRRLRAALENAVREHMAELPRHDPAHPLLRHSRRALRIAGSWSVRLVGGGFHVNHLHPEGVLSSACYLALPAERDQNGDKAGWLELGRPPAQLALPVEPIATIEPRRGHLALFPSYLYHGTRPFPDGERLTVAFDVVPA